MHRFVRSLRGARHHRVRAVIGCGLLTISFSPSCSLVLPSEGDLLPAACSEDLASDPENCGKCGHSCRGGKCIGAVCQPVALAVEQPNPSDVAVDSTGVYWSNGGDANNAGSIVVLRVDGTLAVLASGQTAPNQIALDADFVYWTDSGTKDAEGKPQSDGAVMKVPKAPCETCAPSMLASGILNASGIAVDDAYVYWTQGDADGGVMRLGKSSSCTAAPSGGTCEVVAPGFYPRGIALAQDRVYWTNAGTPDTEEDPFPPPDGSIASAGKDGKCPADPDCPHLVVTDQATPVWIAVDEPNVFWTTFKGGTIMSAPRDDPAGAMKLGQGGPSSIVVDRAYVYWTDHNEGTIIRRAREPNAVGETIARNQMYPYCLALDEDTIYWTDETGGTVMKLAK